MTEKEHTLMVWKDSGVILKGSLPQKVESEEGRLHLYLAEYVWRYNNRKLSNEQKVKRIIELLKKRRSV